MLITIFLLGLQFVGELSKSGQFFTKHFNSDIHGAHEQNWMLEKDSEGFIYVANQSALLKYNGSDWVKILIPNKIVSTIKYDPKTARLYIGGLSEFGYIITTEKPHKYYSLTKNWGINEGFGEIRNILLNNESLFLSSTSTILVQQNNKITRLKSTNYGTFKTAYFYKEKIFLQISVNKHEKNDYSVYELKGKRLEKVIDGTILSFESIIHSTVENNRHYFFTYQGKVFLEKNNKISLVKNDKKWLKAGFLSVKKVNQFYYVASQKKGLFILDKDFNTVSHLTENRGLGEDFINDLIFDKNHNLWLAGNTLISKIITNKQITYYNTKNHIDGFPHSITIDQKNKTFVTTSGGLYKFQYPKKPDFKIIKSNVFLNSSALYEKELFTGGNEGLSLYSLTNKSVNQLLKHQVLDIFLPQYGNIGLIFTRNNIIVYDFPKKKKIITHKLSINPKEILISKESIWFFTDKRILRFRKSTYSIEEFSDKINIKRSVIYPFLYKNSLHVLTKKKYYIWNENDKSFKISTFKKFNFLRAIPSEFFSSFNSGFSFHKDKILYFYDNGTDEIIEVIEKKAKRVNDIKIDNNYLWILQNDMIIRSEIKRRRDKNTDIFIYSIKSQNNQKTIPIDSIYLNYDNNSFYVELETADYSNTNEYKFKILPMHEKWYKNINKNKIYINNLSPDNYKLLISSSNKNSNLIQLKFKIFPPWYQSKLAYIIYTVTGIILIFIMIKIAIKKQVKKANERLRLEKAESKARELELQAIIEKEKLRNRIAEDLHDDLGIHFTDISYSAQILIQKFNKEKNMLEKIKKSAQEAHKSMREIVWSIDPENESLDKIVQKMKETANFILQDKKINFHTKAFRSRLDIYQNRNLFLFFKEALNNINKHAEATVIDIEFFEMTDSLNLTIKDNGIGFEQNPKNNGYGLKNFKKRAKNLNAKFDLITKKNAGVKISLEIPLLRYSQ